MKRQGGDRGGRNGTLRRSSSLARIGATTEAASLNARLRAAGVYLGAGWRRRRPRTGCEDGSLTGLAGLEVDPYLQLSKGTTTEAQATPVVVSLPAGDTASAVGPETYSATAYAISVAPLTFTPAPLAFGNVPVGTSSSASTTVTYTTSVDSTNISIGIDSATPVGPDAADFSVTSNSCSSISLPAQTSRATSSARSRCSSPRRSSAQKTADLAVAWETAGGESGPRTWR